MKRALGLLSQGSFFVLDFQALNPFKQDKGFQVGG
jgi:hypothetical protein